jgi:hypothetical protein
MMAGVARSPAGDATHDGSVSMNQMIESHRSADILMIAPALRNREPAYVQYTRAIGALNQLFRRFAIRRPAST